jgi:hypothetical protein
MHNLKEPDNVKRLQYCMWFTHFIPGGTDILGEVLYSDKAWLHLSGYVNCKTAKFRVPKIRMPS